MFCRKPNFSRVNSNTLPMIPTLEDFEKFYQREDPWKVRGSILSGVLSNLLKQNLGNRSHRYAIDIACGEGHLTKELKLADHQYGMDISSLAIMRAKKYYPELSFIQHDIRIPLMHKKVFDLVTVFDVLYYFSDSEQSQVLANIRNLGNHTSTFAFSVVISSLYSQDRRYFTLESATQKISENFRITKIIAIVAEFKRNTLASYLHAIETQLFNKKFLIWRYLMKLKRIELKDASKVLFIAESKVY